MQNSIHAVSLKVMNTYEQMLKSRYLRGKETKAEKMLWEELRNNKLDVRFRRQHPLDIFVADFYCPTYKFIVELDGKDHATKDGKEYDKMRTDYFVLKGIDVIRFWNNEVENNILQVIDKIKHKIEEFH